MDVRSDATEILYREDLEDMGLDPDAAYFAARQRLARLVAARLISTRTVRGPNGARILVFQHSFLAASCIVLPNLFELARAALDVERMSVVIARRDLLIVLPELDATGQAEVRRLVGSSSKYPIMTLAGPSRRACKEEHTLSIDVAFDDEATVEHPSGTHLPPRSRIAAWMAPALVIASALVVACGGSNSTVDDPLGDPTTGTAATLPSAATSSANPAAPGPADAPVTPAAPAQSKPADASGAADAGPAKDAATPPAPDAAPGAGLPLGAQCLVGLQCASGFCLPVPGPGLRCAKIPGT